VRCRVLRARQEADGSEAVAINVRCLEGIDFAALKPTPVDGRSG
jgi:hypothetical protein